MTRQTAHRSGPTDLPVPDLWEAPIQAWSRYLGASGVTHQTSRVRRCQVRQLARGLGPDPWAITSIDLIDWFGRYGSGSAGRKGLRSTIRGFYSWAVLVGHVDRSPADALPVVSVPAGIPRPAPAEAVVLALAVADARTRLMICLGMYAGLRRFEIAKVHMQDIRDGMLYVVGKGGKHRMIPVHPALLEEVEAWVLQLSTPEVVYEGWLFPSTNGGHLEAYRVGELVSDALPDRWTTHTLRHRFATQAYAVDRDLRAVQELMGHSKPETTARYTAVPDGALTAAVAGVGLL